MPPEVYNAWGDRSWWWVDPLMAISIDALREHLYGANTGPNYGITINDWASGGNYRYSGFRPRSCTEGGEMSQHRIAKGFDCKFKGGKDPFDVAAEIIKHKDDKFIHINCIEDPVFTKGKNIPWLHIDGRNTDQRILIVKP